MAACLREEGIGPDHALVFDIPPEVCIKAKIKPPLSDSLFEKGAARLSHIRANLAKQQAPCALGTTPPACP